MNHPLIACILSVTALAASSCFASLTSNPAEPLTEHSAPEAAPESRPAIKVAFLLPTEQSQLNGVSQMALNGLLAANYASSDPVEVLLIRQNRAGTIAAQVERAAQEGALVAIGPLDRGDVEQLSRAPFLPLPVITLNQVDLNQTVALSQEEIEQKQREEQAQQLADQAQRELNAMDPTVPITGMLEAPTTDAAAVPQTPFTQPVSIETMASEANVPGLVLARDLPPEYVRYEPRKFPRQMLMMGLSVESETAYITQLGVASLPRLTEAGERPKVLLLDHDSPFEKRISQAFERELKAAGFAPDRLTIDINEFRRVTKFFDLIVEDSPTQDAEPEEELIDQEADPLGWRQQQLRLRKQEAARRARAALAEPPYHAIFLALDAKTASLIRPRLPVRSRVWATSAIYPGNPDVDSGARALTYDLKQVAFADSPMIINFDKAGFESYYKVPEPTGVLEKRLFALGADALALARSVAHGDMTKTLKGLSGTLSYDLNVSPSVRRTGTPAMIWGGSIKIMSEQDIIDYQVVAPGSTPLLPVKP